MTIDELMMLEPGDMLYHRFTGASTKVHRVERGEEYVIVESWVGLGTLMLDRHNCTPWAFGVAPAHGAPL